MLSNSFELYLRSISPDQVTEVFLWATLGLLAFATYQGSRGKHSHFLEYAPTLMTSLGILGTFTGIVIGLLHFDTAKIDESIPVLLGGLKTAFLTSVVGMFAAMAFNALDAWWFAPKRALYGGATPDITPADIHATLKTQNAHLEEIVRCLGGDSDGSLIGQIKLLRSDFGDFSREQRAQSAQFNTKLWSELQRFADMLSRSATEQIIEALRQVILDFNNNLTEQFGDNFKRLDDSVQKLVVWQAQYKDQVERMGEQYQQSVESLVETRKAVAGIWDECKEIPLAMAELRTVLLVNQHQIQELERHLRAFVEMRDAAINAVPILQQKIEEVAEQMRDGAGNLQAALEETGAMMLENSNRMQIAFSEGAEQLRDSMLHTQQSFSAVSNDVSAIAGELRQNRAELSEQHRAVVTEFGMAAREVIGHMESSAVQAQQNLSHAMERMIADLANVLEGARSRLDASFNDAITSLGADVNAKLQAFEEGTLRELERTLEIVGQSLTSITDRFVNDYEQLVERMDQILRSQPGGRQ